VKDLAFVIGQGHRTESAVLSEFNDLVEKFVLQARSYLHVKGLRPISPFDHRPGARPVLNAQPPPRPVGRGAVASACVTTSEDRQKLAETIQRHLEIEDRILQALRSAELPPPDEFKALVREQDELSRTINELSEKLFT
jgi:hypothetical protein